MELNKPLSVHMTHEEYEQYKKFLSIKKQCGSILLSYNLGMGCMQRGLGVFNETETVSILNAQIEELRKENLTSFQEGKKYGLSETNMVTPRRKGWLW